MKSAEAWYAEPSAFIGSPRECRKFIRAIQRDALESALAVLPPTDQERMQLMMAAGQTQQSMQMTNQRLLGVCPSPKESILALMPVVSAPPASLPGTPRK